MEQTARKATGDLAWLTVDGAFAEATAQTNGVVAVKVGQEVVLAPAGVQVAMVQASAWAASLPRPRACFAAMLKPGVGEGKAIHHEARPSHPLDVLDLWASQQRCLVPEQGAGRDVSAAPGSPYEQVYMGRRSGRLLQHRTLE